MDLSRYVLRTYLRKKGNGIDVGVWRAGDYVLIHWGFNFPPLALCCWGGVRGFAVDVLDTVTGCRLECDVVEVVRVVLGGIGC